MKIIIIHIGEINKYPPVISLISLLNELKIKNVVITSESDFVNNKFEYTKYYVLPFKYESLNKFQKILNLYKTRNEIDLLINKVYDDDTVIWITYNVSLKHININSLIKKKYIIQLMELSEKVLYMKNMPFSIDIEKVANNALAVVVPEYNRAHITKAWWHLKKMPYILPNKPYYKDIIIKNSPINDVAIGKLIEKLRDKKIILYQGIISEERPVSPFIEAVEELGDEYAFLLMSSGDFVFSNKETSNYYFIPYIKPPLHLQITSHAHIGVLAYVPVYGEFSCLNSLYCAPNKVYEYSMFGLPMLGNDIPGLNYLFKTNNCGCCFSDFTKNSIIDAIKNIEENYGILSENSYKLYNQTDNKAILLNILNDCKTLLK